MGLKCRLLGHEYGDPEIEREREENGDEVVVSIRELQVCARCGKEMVVSENKEVTSIRTPEEVGLDDDGATGSPAAASETQPAAATDADRTPADSPRTDRTPADSARTGRTPTETNAPAESDAGPHIQQAEPDVAAEEGGATADEAAEDDFEPPQDPNEDDAVILDDEGTERDDTQWPEETETDPSEAAEHSAALEDELGSEEEVTDDAEFIDADEDAATAVDTADTDAETGDRGHGEWPAREDYDTEGSDTSVWPEHESDDEGFDAQPSDGEPADVSFGGGLTPEMNGHAARATEEYVSSDDGFTRAEEQGELETNVPDDRVEFYCPNCDHARTAGASSMRAGDICPKCKQGYIAEREL
jgi:hypothetical protein